MRDVAEMFGDEPDRLFCGHPVASIKSRQVHRARVAPQCAFAAKVEVDIEITHRELAQAAIDRLAITAASKIGFRHRAPMTAYFKNRDDMIGVLFRFQIEDQGRKTDYPQRGCGENSTIETRRYAIMQNFLRRTRVVAKIVRKSVEEFLYAGGRL